MKSINEEERISVALELGGIQQGWNIALYRFGRRGAAARCAGSGLARRSQDHDEVDRARGSLDRHATYIVAAYLAGAAR
jgi:hypothetical protein